MYLTSEVKKEIFEQYGKNATDTGSPEAQVALFTHRIKHLTEHVKANGGDKVTKRSLINLVGKRKKMLEYLKKQDIERYRALIKKLGLRK
ncbi:MAG: 30S ribosomal protein S15 [Bacteroidales bacterium]|nr:30S ribosomal protein S15 [Bacteroidales bacterium]